MKVQYEDSCLSQGRVYEWAARFQNGRLNVNDEHRSGRPVSLATETVKQQIEQGARKLVDSWTKCVTKQGDYVKK
jgi:transposase